MKVKVILSIITIMVGATVFGFFQAYQAHAEQDLDRSDQAEILDATLQIEITVPVDASGKRLLKAEGLGSLVWDGKQALLVTHNHWGEVLQEKSQVVLYDAQGRMVKTMSGSEFISLMLYLDAGSLILRSPLGGVEQTRTAIAGDTQHPYTEHYILLIVYQRRKNDPRYRSIPQN